MSAFFNKSLTTFLVGVAVSVASGADWAENNVQFLYGDQFELSGNEEQSIISFEHASGWKYGDNHLFVDVTAPDKEGTEVYGEWSTRVAPGRFFDITAKEGLFKEAFLTAEYDFGNSGGFCIDDEVVELETRVLLYGGAIDLNLPGFNFFQLNVQVRDDDNQDGQTYQITPVWGMNFDIAALSFEFSGFIDFAGDEGDSEANILAQPQLLLDVGEFFNAPKSLYVGTEYQYWENKYGVKGIDESFAQAMVKWYW